MVADGGSVKGGDIEKADVSLIAVGLRIREIQHDLETLRNPYVQAVAMLETLLGSLLAGTPGSAALAEAVATWDETSAKLHQDWLADQEGHR